MFPAPVPLATIGATSPIASGASLPSEAATLPGGARAFSDVLAHSFGLPLHVSEAALSDTAVPDGAPSEAVPSTFAVPDLAPPQTGNSLPHAGIDLPSLRQQLFGAEAAVTASPEALLTTEIPHSDQPVDGENPIAAPVLNEASQPAPIAGRSKDGVEHVTRAPEKVEDNGLDPLQSETLPLQPATPTPEIIAPGIVSGSRAAPAITLVVAAKTSEVSARSRSYANLPHRSASAVTLQPLATLALEAEPLAVAAPDTALSGLAPASASASATAPSGAILPSAPPAGIAPALAVPPPSTPPPSTQPVVAPTVAAATIEQVIEQVAEAREAGRGLRPEMTVRHSEFGAVAMRLEPVAAGWRGPADWRATLTARDPGFVPAVNAALGERIVAAAGEGAAAQNNFSQRSPDQQSQSFAQNSHGGLAAGFGGGEARYGSSPGSGHANGKPYLGDEGDGGSTGTAMDQADPSAPIPRDGSLFA